MCCTLRLSRSCTAALFLCNPLYGFINDKVKEKPCCCPAVLFGKGSARSPVGKEQPHPSSGWVAPGMPLLDHSPGSSQLFPTIQIWVLIIVTPSSRLFPLEDKQLK